jgi:hypothetical protein
MPLVHTREARGAAAMQALQARVRAATAQHEVNIAL